MGPGRDRRRRAGRAGRLRHADTALAAGDRVVLEIDVSPRLTAPNPRIDAVRGCVALERGPIVYCVEEHDLPAGVDLAAVAVDPAADPVDSGPVAQLGGLPGRGAGGRRPRPRTAGGKASIATFERCRRRRRRLRRSCSPFPTSRGRTGTGAGCGSGFPRRTRSEEAAMATLSLEQLTKVFANGVEAVRQLDLFVDDGEFVVLVGPSGCGKTTALRMVAGLEDVTAGTIRLNDKVVNDLSAKERDVAMVFQNYALYPHMNVLENIAFSLRVRGVSKQERERKARETADILGLSEVVLRKPAPALGRSAPARRHGAGAHPRAGRVPHGRAALEPRRQPARPDAQRGAADPAAARRGDALRHPRPDRGDDDGRPGRGPSRRHRSSSSPRRRSCTSGPRTSSSPRSSARRR